MESNFASARMESTRINKYRLKHLKNKTARDFILEYSNAQGEITSELRKLACLYERLSEGSLDNYFSDLQLEKVTSEQLERINKEIIDTIDANFIKFYNSYRRKINIGYCQEIVDSAFSDLKIAYFTYRKVKNPLWSLIENQITEAEMSNLYNLLVPRTDINLSKKEMGEK